MSEPVLPGPPGRTRGRVEELETRLRAEELLDPALDQEQLIGLALEIALASVHADAALLLLAAERGKPTVHARLRGEAEHRSLGRTRSQLAHDTLRTGRAGVQRERDTPGAIEASELLGELPAFRIAAPLRRGDRAFGVLEAVYREEAGDALEGEVRALRSVADHLAVALDAARLVRAERRRANELAHLIDIGTKISSHVTLDRVLEAILGAIDELVKADAIGIFLIDRATGNIRLETVRGYEVERVHDMTLRVERGILGWVAREGRGLIVPDVDKDPRYVRARTTTRSEMAAPLTYEGEVIGVFNLESDRRSAFDDHDLELLGTFANQAAISITHARLHEEATQKRRLEEQLGIARSIQESLLPRTAPRIPGHALAGRNIPSSDVGGDYFDFLPLDDDRWAIIVADVSGSGIPAGLIMAGFRAEIRAELRRQDEPRAILAHVNSVLVEELDPDYFVTAFVGVYAPASGTLVYCSGGHEPGLLVRGNGDVEELSEGGLLLGVFADAEYRQAMVNLAPGDRLLLYTDGLSDAGDPWGDRLGIEGVLRILHEAEEEGVEPAELPSTLLERAAHQAPVPLDEADDRTLVILTRERKGKGA
jgi:phosphoserine phosphatase RsbU/P